jgi:hypothetical protein
MAEFALAIVLESNGAPMALMYDPFSSSSFSTSSFVKEHQLTQTQDLSLHLNKIENEKWSTEKTAFENLRQQAGDGEFLFEIPVVKANK